MNKSLRNVLLLGAVVALSGSVMAAAKYDLADRDAPDAQLRRKGSFQRIQDEVARRAEASAADRYADAEEAKADIKRMLDKRRHDILTARQKGIDSVAKPKAEDLVSGVPALTPGLLKFKSGDPKDPKNYEPVADWKDAQSAGKLFMMVKNPVSKKNELVEAPADALKPYEDFVRDAKKAASEDAERYRREVERYGQADDYLKAFELARVNNPLRWTLAKARMSDPDADTAAKYYEEHRKNKTQSLETQLTKDKLDALVRLQGEVDFGDSFENSAKKAFSTDPEAAVQALEQLMEAADYKAVSVAAFDALMGLTKAPTATAIDNLLALTGTHRAAWEAALRGAQAAASGNNNGGGVFVAPPPAAGPQQPPQQQLGGVAPQHFDPAAGSGVQPQVGDRVNDGGEWKTWNGSFWVND